MGLCTAFGPQIREGCEHPMIAGANACYCELCGVKCTSKFEGCRDVWAGAKPIPVTFVERPAGAAATNGAAPSPSPAVESEAPQPAPAPPPSAVQPAASPDLKALMNRIDQLERDALAALDRHRDEIRKLTARITKFEGTERR